MLFLLFSKRDCRFILFGRGDLSTGANARMRHLKLAFVNVKFCCVVASLWSTLVRYIEQSSCDNSIISDGLVNYLETVLAEPSHRYLLLRLLLLKSCDRGTIFAIHRDASRTTGQVFQKVFVVVLLKLWTPAFRVRRLAARSTSTCVVLALAVGMETSLGQDLLKSSIPLFHHSNNL